MSSRPFLLVATLVSSLVALSGCDQLGIESASVTAARQDADGKAVGAACRHGGRAIEDCFTLNRRVDKAAIYAGWRDMDDYMRENKIEAVVPTLGADGRSTKTADAGDGTDAPAPKPAEKKVAKADKGGDKSSDKGGDKPADKSLDKADKTASADADKTVSAH